MKPGKFIRQLNVMIDSLETQLLSIQKGLMIDKEEEKDKKTVNDEEVADEDQKVERAVMTKENETPIETNETRAYSKFCQPSLHLPQKPLDAKFKEKNREFLKVLKELQVNIPSLDPTSEMSSCAKFIEEVIFHKIKLEEYAIIATEEEYSTIDQNE